MNCKHLLSTAQNKTIMCENSPCASCIAHISHIVTLTQIHLKPRASVHNRKKQTLTQYAHIANNVQILQLNKQIHLFITHPALQPSLSLNAGSAPAGWRAGGSAQCQTSRQHIALDARSGLGAVAAVAASAVAGPAPLRLRRCRRLSFGGPPRATAGAQRGAAPNCVLCCAFCMVCVVQYEY